LVPLAALLALLAWMVGAQRAVADPDRPLYSDVRLMATDLVDELVYSWISEPPLPERTALILADVAAPVGLDERFTVMVENRLYELLRQNPGIKVDLAHCGPCTQFIAKSNPQGTILSRGVDQPEVLAQLVKNMPGREALSLDFEAEGRELVLRAQVFELTGVQKIVWAKTYSTSLSGRRALRDTSPLISLDEARARQRAILAGRDPLEVTSRLVVRIFNASPSAPVSAAPLPFFEQSFEAVPLPSRALRAAVTVGFTSIKDSLSAWSVGGHVAHLLLRDTPSLVDPDLYLTFGMHYIRMRGPGALAFSENGVTPDQINNMATEPKATLVSWRLGLETHIKFRLGMLAFLEYTPTLDNSNTIEKKSFLGVPYQSLGWGMVVRW